MEETYIKIKGIWTYLYRAVDREGNTIDFMLFEKPDKAAATAYFKKDIDNNVLSHTVTMDKSGANKVGIDSINLQLALLFMFGGIFYQIKIRQIKYLNNIVGSDHQFIEKISKPMMGFKTFNSAKAPISGIEFHHMLRKNQNKDADNFSIFEQFYNLAA